MDAVAKRHNDGRTYGEILKQHSVPPPVLLQYGSKTALVECCNVPANSYLAPLAVPPLVDKHVRVRFMFLRQGVLLAEPPFVSWRWIPESVMLDHPKDIRWTDDLIRHNDVCSDFSELCLSASHRMATLFRDHVASAMAAKWLDLTTYPLVLDGDRNTDPDFNVTVVYTDFTSIFL
jgi:hypothetical protein